MPIRAAVDLWNYVGAVFASIGYAATIMWIVKRGMLAGLRRRLAAVGQMALSNYLFHSVTASVLFLGWAKAGRFDYAAQLLIVVAIWIVQLIVSPIWLQRFRFGPAEWLWSTLTYGQCSRYVMRHQRSHRLLPERRNQGVTALASRRATLRHGFT